MIPILFAVLVQAECPEAGCLEDPVAFQATATDEGLWIGGLAFDPTDIESVAVGADSYTGGSVVLVTFTRSGQTKFAKAQEERVEDILEIWVDGVLVSAPILREPIEGPEVQISGTFDWKEAEAIAERIRHGQ